MTKNARLIIMQEDISTIIEIPNLSDHQKIAKMPKRNPRNGPMTSHHLRALET